MRKTTSDEGRGFKRIFNMNYVLGKVLSYGAYIIVTFSVIVLAYLSFVETFNFKFDWKTIGIFSGAAILLSWTIWNTFYHKQYEKLMNDDINKYAEGEYSVHKRYYDASKDWTDAELQIAIDQFNEEYTKKWLNWVEKTTGVPIETTKEKYTDENGKEQVRTILGIKDRPYKGFKYKILMWRIKHHKYPKSGYKTSMELLSLFSYQDANFNKRDLRADKKFYAKHTVSKLITSILIVVTGASLLPEFIDGNYWAALLKLALAIGTLFSALFMGAVNGVRGARLKLSIVEDACADMERWANKKPTLTLYNEPEPVETTTDEQTESSESESEKVTPDIFSQLKIPK